MTSTGRYFFIKNNSLRTLRQCGGVEYYNLNFIQARDEYEILIKNV